MPEQPPRSHPFVLGQSLVSGSAMIVVAILNIGLFLFAMTQPKRLPPPDAPSSFRAGYAIAQLASDPVSLGISLGALAGGVSIVRRENQTIAMLGSIVSCIPCQPVCFLAIPIGLWNVILLARYGQVIFAKKVGY